MLGLHGQGGDLQGCVVHQVDGHQQSNKDIIVWMIPCQAARPSCSRVGLPEGSHVPGGGLQGLHDWLVHQGGGHQQGHHSLFVHWWLFISVQNGLRGRVVHEGGGLAHQLY